MNVGFRGRGRLSLGGGKRERLVVVLRAKSRHREEDSSKDWDERRYAKIVAPKPKISLKQPLSEEQHMEAAAQVHDWHEHQWDMLQLLSKLETGKK